LLALALERESIKKKAQEVEELTKLIKEYSVIGIANLYKVRAIQLQELARKFRSKVQMKVSKNILLKMAIRNSNRKEIERLIDRLKGSNIMLLTNMNPFKLLLLLERSKIRMTAKAGDIAPEDIVISAGNTALPPGPAISELSDIGVRTRIQEGSVWVIRDTVIAKKGETITPNVASVLSKLGIKSLEVGLKMVAAYEDGLVLSSDQLTLDLDEIRDQFEEGFNQAFNLSLNASYPTNENLAIILRRAYSNARNIAINSAYIVPEVASQIIAKAHSDMLKLASRLSQVSEEAVPPEHHG
jgi:large subunit ribosomal protein L10